MGRNTKINIAIVTVSTITTFLQALFLSVSGFYSHISIQIVNAVLSATIVALESFQLNIKRLKLRSELISAQRSRENSRRNSSALRSTTASFAHDLSCVEASDLSLDEEVQIASIGTDLSTGEAEVGEK